MYLVIQGMRFEFGMNANVFLEEGAILTVENGTVFTAYNCPNTMWNGITIESTSALIIRNNCVIEHARIGIRNFTPSTPKVPVFASGYIVV